MGTAAAAVSTPPVLLLFFSAAASASGTTCEGSPPHPRGCGRTRHFGSPVAHRKCLCASTPFISEMLAKLKELQSHGGGGAGGRNIFLQKKLSAQVKQLCANEEKLAIASDSCS